MTLCICASAARRSVATVCASAALVTSAFISASAALLVSTLSAAQASVAVFEGARIIDGNGGAPIEDGVMLVQDGRVAAVETNAHKIPPKELRW